MKTITSLAGKPRRSGAPRAASKPPSVWRRPPWLLILAQSLAIVDLWGTSGMTGGELLVKWNDGPTSAAAVAGNARIGATVKRDFNAVGWQLVELPHGMTLADGRQAYRTLDGVLLVEPNRRLPLALPPAPEPADPVVQEEGLSRTPRLHGPALAGVTPDDPLFPQQWHLRKIGATNAWATTTGSADVVVAIIDTGVDYTHPDLAPNMWRNPGETGPDDQGADRATNGLDDDGNGYADDVHGADVSERTGDPMDTGFWETPVRPKSDANFHGTFIAGLVGAAGNNAIGGAGLNWSVRLMAIRYNGVDVADPRAFQFTESIAVAAWDYAVTMKRRGVNLRVINLSSGDYRPSVPWADVIQTAGDEGILTVCAAGNSAANNDLWSGRPASYNISSILSVAASTESDGLATFSSYGATTVDLAAPGINMSSTWKSPGYSSGRQGASHAAPLVAGTAALLLARDPGLSVDQLKAALLGSTDQPAGLRGKLVSHGRLNVARALEYLTLGDPPAIVVHAAPGGQRTLPDEPLRLTFSRPMNRASVEAAFAITPAVAGTFEWSADHRHLVVRHDVPFDTTSAYTVRLGGTAQDESGGTLDGDFDRRREGSPADDFVWSFRFQIPNDDFADAQVLVGESGSVAGSNRYAFIEWGEPNWFATSAAAYGSSLWYRWTAPTDEWFTFDLGPGTSFDSVLVVSTGNQLHDLEGVAWNDQYGSRTYSRVSFGATAGTAYSIVVANKANYDLSATGSFRLSWYPTPSPGFTGSQFSPVRGMPGAKVTLTGTNFTGATAVLFHGARAHVIPAPGENEDLRVVTHVPSDATSGPITLVTPHGSVTSSTEFSVLPTDGAAPAVRRITALAAAAGDAESLVTVVFDQPLEPDSAQSPSNYVIGDGTVAVRTARLQDDWRSVVLTTGALLEGASQSMTVGGIAHRFQPAAAAMPATHSFEATHQVLAVGFDDPADPGVNTTGNAHSAFVVDNPQVVPGAVGSALRFDGSADYLDVPYSRSLDIGGDITIAAWVRREAFGEYGGILAKTSGALDQWDYVLYFPAGSDTLRFWSDGQHPLEVASTGSVTSGSWHHVAVTRSGDTVSFFINGRGSGSATVTGRMPDRQFPVRIGTDGPYYSVDSMYRGQLDDVRLYNTALSEAAIRQLAIPALVIRGGDTEITLSWAARGGGLVLEESEDLRGAAWSVMTRAPTVRNGQNELKLAAPAGARFFRLRSP